MHPVPTRRSIRTNVDLASAIVGSDGLTAGLLLLLEHSNGTGEYLSDPSATGRYLRWADQLHLSTVCVLFKTPDYRSIWILRIGLTGGRRRGLDWNGFQMMLHS